MDASLVLDAIVAASIAAGALFAILELREITRTRRTQLVIDLMRHSGTVEFMEQWDKVWNADFSSRDGWQKCSEVSKYVVAEFYEQVGTLMRLKLIDADLVYEMMGIANIYDKMKPWCLWLRAEYGTPEAYENFEYAAQNQASWDARKLRERVAREESEKKGI